MIAAIAKKPEMALQAPKYVDSRAYPALVLLDPGGLQKHQMLQRYKLPTTKRNCPYRVEGLWIMT